MTVSSTNVVDWLGIETGTGNIVLDVVDDLDWTDEHEHLWVLQEKLNAYLRFIESGEVFEKLRKDVGREVPRATPIKVSILAKHPLTAHAQAFLEHAKMTFAQASIELVFEVLR